MFSIKKLFKSENKTSGKEEIEVCTATVDRYGLKRIVEQAIKLKSKRNTFSGSGYDTTYEIKAYLDGVADTMPDGDKLRELSKEITSLLHNVLGAGISFNINTYDPNDFSSFEIKLTGEIENRYITSEEALEALESIDDCARMDIGVEPTGPYAVLKRYIEQ